MSTESSLSSRLALEHWRALAAPPGQLWLALEAWLSRQEAKALEVLRDPQSPPVAVEWARAELAFVRRLRSLPREAVTVLEHKHD